jgi:hypothetical protein
MPSAPDAFLIAAGVASFALYVLVPACIAARVITKSIEAVIDLTF